MLRNAYTDMDNLIISSFFLSLNKLTLSEQQVAQRSFRGAALVKAAIADDSAAAVVTVAAAAQDTAEGQWWQLQVGQQRSSVEAAGVQSEISLGAAEWQQRYFQRI